MSQFLRVMKRTKLPPFFSRKRSPRKPSLGRFGGRYSNIDAEITRLNSVHSGGRFKDICLCEFYALDSAHLKCCPKAIKHRRRKIEGVERSGDHPLLKQSVSRITLCQGCGASQRISQTGAL